MLQSSLQMCNACAGCSSWNCTACKRFATQIFPYFEISWSVRSGWFWLRPNYIFLFLFLWDAGAQEYVLLLYFQEKPDLELKHLKLIATGSLEHPVALMHFPTLPCLYLLVISKNYSRDIFIINHLSFALWETVKRIFCLHCGLILTMLLTFNIAKCLHKCTNPKSLCYGYMLNFLPSVSVVYAISRM